MFSRKLNSEISYPFIPEVPDRKYIAGIMDIHLVVSGPATGSITSSYKAYHAYLKSITQGTLQTTYVFYAVNEQTAGDSCYQFTFIVPWTMGLGVVQNSVSESSRGALVINATYNYRGGNLVMTTPGYELEPGTQLWLEKKVESVNFVNEYRDFDPTQRASLSNDILYSFQDSDHIEIGAGNNVSLGYTSGILTLDGNAGNGIGLAEDNMWDTGPTWDPTQDGLLMVNGIVPDANGDIPIDKSISVSLIQKEGELEIGI